MHELYELKELLCDELKKYGGKGELSAGSLEIVDKLAHAAKNLDKVIESYEDDGYSGRYYYGDRTYRGSYARRRDRMGRYSRDGMADKLRELMHDAPDDRTREEIRKLADKMESM